MRSHTCRWPRSSNQHGSTCPAIAIWASKGSRDEIGGNNMAKKHMETALAQAEEQWTSNRVKAELQMCSTRFEPARRRRQSADRLRRTHPRHGQVQLARQQRLRGRIPARQDPRPRNVHPMPTATSMLASGSTTNGTAQEGTRMPRAATSCWFPSWMAKSPVKVWGSARIARRPGC